MLDKNNILYILKKRGLIFQISDYIDLYNYINSNIISLYCGFDPTADSLHVGHLLPIICLRYFQKLGHKLYIILGGATSMIGDPSFKLYERKDNNSIETVFLNQERIMKQLLFFFSENNSTQKNVIFLNNYTWFKKISILNFLKDIGKNFSINNMINKESVKKRFLNAKTGISFTEFSYSLLQAYDFLNLYKKYGVTLQIGGSDQWGNIISGIHLIKNFFKKKVYGFTVPLFTKSNGDKFGKTENNTIWLDAKKTSPYKFYQFWINITDDKLSEALRFFTLLDNSIYISKNNSDNVIQNIINKKIFLADIITQFVHGKRNLISVKRITKCLFGKKSISNMIEEDFLQLLQDGIPYIICKNVINLPNVLVKSKLSHSLCHARNLIKSGAVRVNNILKIEKDYSFKINDRIFGKYTILRKGKKYFILIYWKF